MGGKGSGGPRITVHPDGSGNLLCSKCKEYKNSSNFYTTKAPRGFGYTCKNCLVEHRNTNKELARVTKYKRKFNITIEEYNQLFEDQKGCCAICGKHQSEFNRRLAQDHNHEYKFNRGLLCNNCNLIIGFVNDNTYILESAIAYLHEWEL